MIASRRVSLFASAALLILGATQAHAQQQILSTIDFEDANDEEDRVLGTVGGQSVSFNRSGNSAKALTDYGVNKVIATATNGGELSATSAWLDTFTAAGAAGTKVKVSLSFTIDGSTQYFSEREDGAPEFDFKVYAMRGSGWTMHGLDDDAIEGPYSARRPGDGYDELFMQRINAQGIEQLDMDGQALTMTNFANLNGEPGAFRSQVSFLEGDDAYRIVTFNQQGNFYTGGYYYDSFFRSGTPEVPVGQPIHYNAGTPLANQLANTRNVLESGFSILDTGTLCSDQEDGCFGSQVIEPTTVTLDFEVLAGQSFTIAGWLYVDDVYDGTADFFNTAKLTGLYAETETGEAVEVASSSGALVARPGGGFGYPNASVPEPAAWAMMILGFGVIGSAARRRPSPDVTYA